MRRLCVLLGAERVYREMASILMEENNAEFVGIMIQALNLILLTSTETAELRLALKASLSNRNAAAFFTALFPSWCHSAVAAISLCLLAQAYGPASRVVASLGDVDTTVDLLVQARPSGALHWQLLTPWRQVDQLVQLLETPCFTFLRLQLLEPAEHPQLLKTLFGLLLLLPQSTAFNTLSARLACVSQLVALQPHYAKEETAVQHGTDLLATFRAVQARRRTD